MQFTEAKLQGAWLIDLAPIEDERGFFACSWAPQEFTSRGLKPDVVQCNLAWNHTRGTIRGMHFQRPPFDEIKIVRCTRGSILDVIVDLRPESQTYCQWMAVELNEDNRRMIYIPPGVAHGYQTLSDGAETYYHVSAPYSPPHSDGVRWNDPVFGIEWPLTPTMMSKRDKEWPDFRR